MFAAMVTESLQKTLFVLVTSLVIKASWAVADKNQNGFTSISSHLPSASMIRVKREVTDNDLSVCGLLEARSKCSSSFNQDYINALSKCGERARSAITSSEHSCRQNGDVYCGEHSLYISSNCTGSCTTQCANALRQGGCCLNGDSWYQELLNRCNISMPERCSPSIIQIPNISQQSSCSSDEYNKQEVKAMCDNIDLLINGFNQEERCEPFSNNYRDYCSYKDNQYCVNQLSSARLQAVEEAANNCSSTLLSFGCSDQCNGTLSQVESTVGCCIHALNATDSSIALSLTNSWEKCEIPVPPKCGGNSITLSSVSSITLSSVSSITLSSVSSKVGWGCYGSLFIVSSFVITHAII